VQKQVLVERHLISREHAARGDGSAAVIERRQTFSLMLNEEDHLRMQAIRPGLQLSAAFTRSPNSIRNWRNRSNSPSIPRSATSPPAPPISAPACAPPPCSTCPALVLSDQIGQVLQAVNKIGLAVRGLYGEGTESLGNLYQISNQSTLGESEETIIRRLERVISQVANHEHNAREKLAEDDPEMVADKIGRAYGMLRHAHIIDSKEALNHLSIAAPRRRSRVFPAGNRESLRHTADGHPARAPPTPLRPQAQSGGKGCDSRGNRPLPFAFSRFP
jgi:protein arginine kinase